MSDVNSLKRSCLIGQLRQRDVRKEFTFSITPRPQTCRRTFKKKKWVKELANLACKLRKERSERRPRVTITTPRKEIGGMGLRDPGKSAMRESTWMVCHKRAMTREAKKREPGNDVGNGGLGTDLGHMSCVICSCYREGQRVRSTCKCH